MFKWLFLCSILQVHISKFVLQIWCWNFLEREEKPPPIHRITWRHGAHHQTWDFNESSLSSNEKVQKPVLSFVVVEEVFQQHLFVGAAVDVWGWEIQQNILTKRISLEIAYLRRHQIEALCWEEDFIVSFKLSFLFRLFEQPTGRNGV